VTKDKRAGWRPSPDIRRDPTQSKWIEEETIPLLKKAWGKYRKKVLALIIKEGERTNIIGSTPGISLPEIMRNLPMLGDSFLEDGTEITGTMIEQAVNQGNAYATEQLIRVEYLPEAASGSLFTIGPPTQALIDTLTAMDLSSLQGITDATSNQIVQAITTGMQEGKGTYEIADAVDAILNDGWNRAETIVRTEVMTAITESTRQRFDEQRVQLCELITSQDDRVCDDCEPLYGEITEVDGPGFGDMGWPPFHPNCRCSVAPVIPGLYDGAYADDLEEMFPEVFS